MGYDCTLHLVDPASFDRFTSWFLREPTDSAAFEKAFDSAGLREEILQKLEQSPSQGGRALLQALLMFCSAEAPHQYSRGFCLGLWSKLELGFADELPRSAISFAAIEEKLGRLVAAHPALEGQLYTGIDGNYSIGHYIGPEFVAAVRAHVEEALDRVRGDWLAAVERVVQVLVAAERRGLGYWEATDLEVANGNRSWLEPKGSKKGSKKGSSKSSKAITKRLEVGAQSLQFSREVNGVVIAGSLSDRKTWFFDVRSGEPAVKVLSEISFEHVAQGADQKTYGVGYVAGSGGTLATLDVTSGSYTRIETPEGFDPRSVLRVGARVLSIGQRRGGGGLLLHWLGSKSVLAVPNASIWGAEAYDLGDESALVNTDGPSFRFRESALEPLATMPPLKFYALGDVRDEHVTTDGRLLVSGCERLSSREQSARESQGLDPPRSRLVLIAKDGTCTDAAPPLDAAQSAWPAKDGAVIVTQFEPIERDLLKVYWHERGEVASIRHALAGEKRGHCQSAIYCATLDELWISFNSHVVRVPWSAIESQPRLSLEQYAAAKSALIAENKRKEHERLWAKIRSEPRAYRVDDSKAYLYVDAIVEHPDRGRGIVREVDRARRTFTMEFEDRSHLQLPLPPGES